LPKRRRLTGGSVAVPPARLFVDSGAWIALVSARDQHHAEAAAHALDRLEASPLLSIEFATAIHHRAARAWLDRLPDQRISYTDAVSFAVMEAARCAEVLSFDHDFVLAGFAPRRAPPRASR
jgi:predicted nucleic acid-binding protein